MISGGANCTRDKASLRTPVHRSGWRKRRSSARTRGDCPHEMRAAMEVLFLAGSFLLALFFVVVSGMVAVVGLEAVVSSRTGRTPLCSKGGDGVDEWVACR